MNHQAFYYQQIIDFINSHDIFWIRELRQELGISHSENIAIENVAIKEVLKNLSTNNIIQCCDFKKRERQYILLKKVTVRDLFYTDRGYEKYLNTINNAKHTP